MTAKEGYLLGEISRIKGMASEACGWDENHATTPRASRRVLELIKDVCEQAIAKVKDGGMK